MRYLNIVKLHDLLNNEGVEHEFLEVYNGGQVIVHLKDMPSDVNISVVEHDLSMGLEMRYGLTMAELKEDCVLGYMTVEDVLKRILYCVKHNTIIYSTRKPYTHSWDYVKKHGR